MEFSNTPQWKRRNSNLQTGLEDITVIIIIIIIVITLFDKGIDTAVQGWSEWNMSYEPHTRKQEMHTVFCLENSWKHISINSDNNI